MPSDDPIARYGLIRPVMGDALVAVHRAHGADAPQVWARLLTAAGLVGHETSDAALDSMIEAMRALDPLSRIVARGLQVRINTYKNLAARNPAAHHYAAATQP